METKRTYDYKPTPEQLLLAEERRRQREAKKLHQQNTHESHTHLSPTFLSRDWKYLPSTQTVPRSTIKVMSWNLLAQCLIRSNLFPTSSKALKTTHREPMIHAEILSHFADIMCMQEVDRLEKLSPVLELAGYSSAYATGPGKQHGCLIAYKQNKYNRLDELVIEYDKQEVREDSAHPAARIGSSRVTKNIGFMVALAEAGADQKGVIVATTHLFWHPAFTYERARQAGILIREVLNFRQSMKLDHWPCIIAGDFNFAPDDPAYSLLIGDPLTEAQSHRLHTSRVIHTTIDPTVPPTTKKADDEEGDGSEADPDRVINNSRVATSSDGLLSDLELTSLFINGAKLRSAYDEGQRIQRGNGTAGNLQTFGDRVSSPPIRLGSHEPMWTSYTHYWKTTLDYIFFVDTPKHSINVAGYLNPHRTTDMEAGLPQIGICGSDHVSLCAELFLS
ncbi:Endonuclease/exonuclease/phosphatase [Suillus clintonianus]|uniref:Endonuclease/exonuclease/phosphatase n=1 Tax=Suillus clintonianus TaxID=1904413 RepID=UPI001B861DF3|nr:Endonuclease/exonuclease/phosphatase [Suillus clintonianus]KAG2118430.1 Endonuclease/exonuclease/phosphatase [Suillus clintonianus]